MKKTNTRTSPEAFAEHIVTNHILRAIDPASILRDEDIMEQACELVAKVGATDKRIQPLDQIVALQGEIRAAVSPDLYARYVKAEDGRAADAVAHLEAGIILGVSLGRAIAKGGR